jgi:hypothetical protein
MNVKQFFDLWYCKLKYNINEFLISFQEDCLCSFLLGIFCIIPLVLYIIYGLLGLIFICLYNSKNITVINEHAILHHIRVVPI